MGTGEQNWIHFKNRELFEQIVLKNTPTGDVICRCVFQSIIIRNQMSKSDDLKMIFMKIQARSIQKSHLFFYKLRLLHLSLR